MGNEFTDSLAKETTKLPLINTPRWKIQYLKNIIKNQDTNQNHSSAYTHLNAKNLDYTKMYKNTLTKITRLKLDHMHITHKYILKLPQTHKYTCINTGFTIQHMLEKCQVYALKIKKVLKNKNIKEIKNPNVEDIILIRITQTYFT